MSEEKHNEKDILTEKLLETRTVIITGKSMIKSQKKSAISYYY